MCADYNDEFYSNVFKMCHIDWQLCVKIGGDKKLKIIIKPCQTPPDWCRINVRLEFYCRQILSSYTSCFQFNRTNQETDGNVTDKGWTRGCISLDEIKNKKLNELHLMVTGKMLQIMTPNNIIHQININPYDSIHQKQSFQWKIDGALLNQIISQRYIGKSYESNIFNNMWCIRIYPFGIEYKHNYKCCIDIQFCGLYNISSNPLYANWNISLKEANINKASHDKLLRIKWENINLSFFPNFQRSLTICVDISITDDIHSNYKGKQWRLKPSVMKQQNKSIKKDNYDPMPQSILPKATRSSPPPPPPSKNNDIPNEYRENKHAEHKRLERSPSPIGTELSGLVEFHIGSYLMSKVLNANSVQWIADDQFKLIKCHWKVNARIRKLHKQLMLHLGIKPVWTPSNWAVITACITIYCQQTLFSATSIYRFHQQHHIEGCHRGGISLQEIKNRNLKGLTFIITIKALRVENDAKKTIYEYNAVPIKSLPTMNHSFQWRIDGEHLQQMKIHAYFGKSYESDIFDVWCLRIFPMGNITKNKGWVCIEIQFCAVFEQKQKPEYWPSYGIFIEENHAEIKEKQKYNDKESFINCGIIRMRFEDFTKLNSMTIYMDFNKDLMCNDESNALPLHSRDSDVPPPPNRLPPLPPKDDEFIDSVNASIPSETVERFPSSSFVNDNNDRYIDDNSLYNSNIDAIDFVSEYVGSYQCHIDRNLLGNVVKMEVGDHVWINWFEMKNVKWELGASIITRKDKSIQINIRPISMTPKWSKKTKITICLTCYCPETLSSRTVILRFNNKKYKRGMYCYDGGIFVDEIINKKINELHLWINIRIIRVEKGQKIIYKTNCDYLRKQSFKWVIDEVLWKEIKRMDSIQCKGKCFESDVINDDLWCLRIYPFDNEIELQFCGIMNTKNKKKVKKVKNVNWSISVEAINFYDILRMDKKSLIDKSYQKYNNILPFSMLKELNKFTISVQVNIAKKKEKKVGQNVVEYKQKEQIDEIKINEENMEDKPTDMNYYEIEDFKQYTLSILDKRLSKMEMEFNAFDINVDLRKKKAEQMMDASHDIANSMHKQFEEMVNNIHCKLNEEIRSLTNKLQHSQSLQYAKMDEIKRKMGELGKLQNANRMKCVELQCEIEEILYNDYDEQLSERMLIRNWLIQTVNLPQYFDILIVNGYDNIQSIMNITNDDLIQIGVDKIGHRRKIIKYQYEIKRSY